MNPAELAATWNRRALRLEADAALETDPQGIAAMHYGALIYRNCALEILGEQCADTPLPLILEDLQQKTEGP